MAFFLKPTRSSFAPRKQFDIETHHGKDDLKLCDDSHSVFELRVGDAVDSGQVQAVATTFIRLACEIPARKRDGGDLENRL